MSSLRDNDVKSPKDPGKVPPGPSTAPTPGEIGVLRQMSVCVKYPNSRVNNIIKHIRIQNDRIKI